MPSVQGAWRAYRTEGWAGVLWRARRSRSWLFNYKEYSLCARSFEDGFDLLPPRYSGSMHTLTARYQLEWLTEGSTASLQSYLAYRQQPRMSEERVRGWLRAGHTTVMLKDGARIIGDCWLALKAFPIPGPHAGFTRMMERLGYGYSYMVYVDPQYRGRGVYPRLLSAHVDIVRREGGSGLLGILLERSTSSKLSLEAMSFRSIGKLYVLRVLGRDYGWTVRS